MGDHARTSAVRHGASRIRHIRTVAERGVRRHRLFGVLFGGNALARERGFLYLQGGGGEQSHIRRHDVARFQLDYVAGDELLAREMFPFAVAEHLGKRLVHVFQGFHGVLRFVFLHHADDRVEDDYEQYDAGVDEFGIFALHQSYHRRDHRRHEEHDDHDVLELFEELDDEALLFALRKRVLAEFRNALFRLG